MKSRAPEPGNAVKFLRAPDAELAQENSSTAKEDSFLDQFSKHFRERAPQALADAVIETAVKLIRNLPSMLLVAVSVILATFLPQFALLLGSATVAGCLGLRQLQRNLQNRK